MTNMIDREVATLSLRAGNILTVAIASGSALIERFKGDSLIDKAALSSGTRTFGSYNADVSVRISCITGTLSYSVSADVGSILSAPVQGALDPVTGGISIYGLVVVDGLVAGDASAASANTAKIQAALTTTGAVLLSAPGVIYINDTLTIYSNTHLTLGSATTIKSAPGTNKVMLTNESQYQTAYSVTLGWTAGTTVTVGNTDHGKLVGDYVWLIGATEARYRGVFRVDSVVDANSYTINLPTTPAAVPSGTITAKNVTKNVIVSGGLWDYDAPNNNGAALDSFAMSFYGIANVAVRDIDFGKSSKYSLTFCAFMNASVKRMNSNTTSDCLKVYGPGNGFELDGLTGTSGDDIVSVQGQEGTPYLAYQIQFGDLHQIILKNINGKQNGTVANVNIYLSDNCILYGLVVDGVGGTGLNNLAVAIQKSAGETTGYAERVSLNNLSPSASSTVYWASGYISHCSINGTQANPHLLAGGTVINFTSGASAGVLDITNLNVKKSGWSSSGAAYGVTLTGAADVVNLSNSNLKTGGGGGVCAVNLAANSSIKTLNVEKCGHNGNIFIYLGGVPTVVPQINLHANSLDGANIVFLAGNANISMTGGNRITNASGGVVKFNNTFTASLSTDGTNQLLAGSWLSVVTGAPVFTVKGFDVALAVNATGIARTAGAYLQNTAAAGTLAANNPVMCDATGAANSWKQMTAPANAY